MTNLRQAAQQALEALCSAVEPKKGKVYAREFEPIDCFAMHEQAIAALRTALEQQQAEPVCPECKAAVLYECVACSSNNNPPQQQEPVLWAMPDGKIADKWALQFYSGQKGKPLYTAPPQRPWQGLREEDWEQIHDKKGTALDTFAQGAVWAADRLKERNNG